MATMKTKLGGLAALALAVGLALSLAACAKKPERDPFMEKWTKKAEEVKDVTYTPRPRKVDFSEAQVTPEVKPADVKPKRDLPVLRVSLNFYNTDLQAVLRSLARIANQNIILSAALQSPENQGKYKVNINVSETPWNQAFESILNANGLSYDWDGEIIRVMTLEDLKNQNDMKKAVAEKMAQAERIKTVEPVVTVKVQVNYADVAELERTIQGYLYPKKANLGQDGGGGTGAGGAGGAGGSPSGGSSDQAIDLAGRVKGFVVADKHSNSIIIQATREHAELLVKLVEKLDEPRLQVHLKAFIVEATKDSLFDLGIQWGGAVVTGKDGSGNRLWVMPGGNSVPVTENSQNIASPLNPQLGTQFPIYGYGPAGTGYGLNYPAAISSSVSGLGAQGAALNFMWGILDGNLLQMQISALARDGKINIVSEPSLTTLDNMTAFTENGERIPFVTVSQNGTNVQFVDAVLRLEMTPHVIDDRNLRMKVTIKNDEVVTDQTRWVQGNPPIRKKQTDTTLIVEDGSTIVISGLAKHSKTDSEQGLPGLKDVPVAGYLVKNTSKQKSKQDILVFITPTVLRNKPAAMNAPGLPQAPPQPRPDRSAPPERQPMPLGPAPAAPQTGRSGG